MPWVAGVDGCKTGWFAVFYNQSIDKFAWDVFPAFLDIVSHELAPSIVGVDVPIGLLDTTQTGGRDCDMEARKLLGYPRASSVFSPPVRSAVFFESYEEANAANRLSSDASIGISKQCFSIIPKIREVDQLITPKIQNTVKEVHPELCFWKMAGNVPTKYAKKKAKGFEERVTLIGNHGLARVLALSCVDGPVSARDNFDWC
ncbi:MAG: DUF429 domain-containing protein [Hyphomicrobiales bacterium]|nr:DUF429 domain-containing protein [Hyphomicrobiales bacterium]